MGRYLVNKLLHEVTLDDALLAKFRADSAGTVGEWEARQIERLGEDERTAVIDKDYGALYAMGVHPFFLWCWCYAVLASDDLTGPQLGKLYREAVSPFGRPDFAT